MDRLNRLLLVLFLAACGKNSVSPKLAGATGSESAAQLVNGSFETDPVGTTPPTGWTVTTYLNQGINGSSAAPPATFTALNLSAAGGGKVETFVVGDPSVPPTALSQFDPDLGPAQSFRYPIYGGRAALVNYQSLSNIGNNKNANSITQTMTMAATDVDPTDGAMHVRFAVAPVLENPGHGYDQQPYFYVELLNLTRGTTLYTAFNTAGQSGIPWHTTTGVRTNNAVQWLDWQLVDITSSSTQLAAGDQVKLTVVGSGCSLGGHFGRIYVDGTGSTIPGPYTTASAPGSVDSQSTLTYTFRYANGGATNALGAHIDMTTPAGTNFNAASFAGGSCTTATGAALTATYAGAITCPLSGPLAAGASGTLAITVNVTAASGTITNGFYSIGAANAPTLLGTPVITTINGTGTTTADISVTKTTTVASLTATDTSHSCTGLQQPACTGITPLYTITVTNNSTTKQLDANSKSVPSLTDVMPASLAPLSGVFWSCARLNNGSGTHSSNQSDCSDSGSAKVALTGTGNISLKPRLGYNASPCAHGTGIGATCSTGAGSITISVWGTVNASAGVTALTNTAASTAGSGVVDPDLSNNSATSSIPIGTLVQLTISEPGTGTGTVVSSQPGINCGATCNAQVVQSTSVVLNASAAPLSQFTGWSSNCAPNPSLATQCTVSMSAAATVTANFTAETVGAAASVYVYSGNSQKVLAPGAFSQPLKALVTDANQNPVSGETVTFLAPITGASVTFSGGSACVSGLSNCRTAVSDSNGVATVSATANATVALPYSVTATDGALAPAIFTLTNYGAPTTLVYLEGGNTTDPGVATINTPFATPLGVIVTDSAGNAIPGVTVGFVAVPFSGESATLSAPSAVSDVNGQALVTATANATSFSLTATSCDVSHACSGSLSCISGFCGDATQNFHVTASSGLLPAVSFVLRNLPAGATNMFVASGSPQTTPVSSPFSQALTVAVADGLGNPVPNVTVNFAAPSSGASATLSAASAVTGITGLASITATANATGGPYVITVTSGALTPIAFALTNDGGDSIAPIAGSGQSAAFNATFTTALQAIVQDANGDFPSVPVTFTAPSTGASVTFSNCIGGGVCTPNVSNCCLPNPLTGTVSITATANAQAGTYNVLATTPLAPGAATFVLTNACSASNQCSGATPICSASSPRACAACSANSDCSTKDATKPFCDTTPGTGGSCFACTADTQCSGTTPICDTTATHACIACSADAQCNNKNATLPFCDGSGACFSCTSSSQCGGTTPGCDPTSHTCVPLACAPALVAPANGTVSATTGVTGNMSTYNCNAGYTISGSSSTTCLADQTWSNPAPTCTPNACAPALVAPTNGSVSSTSGVTGSTSTYSCNAGYTISGLSMTACQTDGTWSHPAPTCTPNACTATLVAPTNGGVAPTTGVTGTTANYTCNSGYTISGTSTSMCQTDATWSGTPPTCTANPCSPNLVAPVNGTISSTTGHTGDPAVTYTCNSGFTLSAGPGSVTCQASGSWTSTTVPTCSCVTDSACSGVTPGTWCDLGTCTATLANGQPMPIIPTHSPAFDGICSPTDTEDTIVCTSMSCDADGECGIANGDPSCTPGATSTVCRSGVCDADGSCGYANGDGSCTPGTPASVCRSNVCDNDGSCGYANGDGPCTSGDASACRSNTCSVHLQLCVPATEGCAEDADCGASQWCNPDTYTCAGKLANKTVIPTTTNVHSPALTGTCTSASGIGSVGAAVCASGVCDPSNNQCGEIDGASCASNTVCQSGDCSLGGQCTSLGGCFADSDCTAAGTWCSIAGNVATSTPANTCVPTIVNANPMPTDTGHTSPVLDGVCRADAAAALVCTSAVCDITDNDCGYADGDGPCTSLNAGMVCRSSTCSPNAFLCIPSSNGCAADADCQSSEWCDPDHNTCTSKLANLAQVPTTTKLHAPPLTGVCTDASVGAAVCTTGACDESDNLCGLTDGNGPCTIGAGAAVCRSGSCSSTSVCKEPNACLADTDCDRSIQYCDTTAHACTAKIVNGGSLPMVGGHTPVLDGICSSDEATVVCASGVCDADNHCGHANGQGTCNAGNAATVCRSGECATSGANASTCVECLGDGQCQGAQAACDTTRNVCVQCTTGDAAACTGSTPLCSSADTCGPASTGGGSTGGTSTGTTGGSAQCSQDSDCSSTTYCNGTACVAELADGAPATRASQCTSRIVTRGFCGAAKLPGNLVLGGDGLARGCHATPFADAMWLWLAAALALRRKR